MFNSYRWVPEHPYLRHSVDIPHEGWSSSCGQYCGMKKAVSFRARRPLLNLRDDPIDVSEGERAESFSKAEKFQKSEQGGSVFCNFRCS